MTVSLLTQKVQCNFTILDEVLHLKLCVISKLFETITIVYWKSTIVLSARRTSTFGNANNNFDPGQRLR